MSKRKEPNFEKPEEGDIYWLLLEKEGMKLNGPYKHPCIVTGHNEDDSSRVVGCSSKENKKLGDVPIHTEPEDMDEPTFARRIDGERDIENCYFTKKSKDKKDRYVPDEELNELLKSIKES